MYHASLLCPNLKISLSQSLLWERMIFQSRAFWKFAGPLVRARFPHTEGVSDEAFYRGLNRVAPSLIRVDADEVTYPLHIILRYSMCMLCMKYVLYVCSSTVCDMYVCLY